MKTILAFAFTLILSQSCKKSDEANDQTIRNMDDKNVAVLNPTASSKVKKVLFIGIDGLVWRTISAASAPNLKTLMDQSLTYTNALAEVPTWSSNGWSALFTGVGVSKHKASDNSFSGADFVNYPSFFRSVKTALPNARTVSIATWASINNNIISPQDLSVRKNSANDNVTQVSIIEELTKNNPDVSFCHFDNVDHAGHASNYVPTTPMYLDSVKAVDVRVGKILQAVKSRTNYNNEDWLIVVATDHGGDQSHGGASYKERNAFIIVNNASVLPKLINQEPTETVQTKPLTVNAATFNSNVYGSLPALSGLDLSAGASFTIEFRVRATNFTSDPVIIGNKNWANGYNKGIIISNRNGVIRANFGDGSKRLDVDGVDLRDQRWHHVAIVVNRTTQKAQIYDGGLLVSEGNISNVGDLQSNQAFKLGQDVTMSYNPSFTGNITEVRFFKKALSPSSISNYAFNFLSESHPDRSSLVFYVKGNDGSGGTFQGSLSSPAATLTSKNGGAIAWTSLSSPIFWKKETDYHGAPYLYTVPPTILGFLGISKPAYYDGNSLVQF
ncbi:alkaline phosphatase family protein [Pedobacter sp. Leaf132]|uniref:alkaline phosphatase family protein n=1 Tax=Pedobacter sp. Leaf132 TaxID=2876557 RepID=UPI001E53A754|nr:alkaline phosphatase family protein [Pedobacter sp. Leaf132]